MFAGQPFEPERLIRPFEVRPGSHGHVAEIPGVPRANLLLLTALLQFFEPVLADRFEHPVADLAVRYGLDPDERLLRQPSEQPEHFLHADLSLRAYGLSGLHCETAGEHG